jgi:hypothetical protein
LPQTLGNNDFRKKRWTIWYKLVGVGFVVMAMMVLALAFMSLALAAVLVIWVYWLGWTWISWRIADKQARSDCEGRPNNADRLLRQSPLP